MNDNIKKNYRSFLRIQYFVCGGFGFVAYFSYLLKLIFWPSNKTELIVALLGIAVSGVPVFFRSFFEKKLPKKLFVWLESIFAYGMLFYCVTFLALSIFIFSAGAMQSDVDELSDDCVFIVYGAGLRDGEPGVTLKKRLDTAYEYMTKLPESVCILSGGQGADEPCSEAQAMKEYLLELGLDEDRIYLEDKSKNTLQNVKLSMELIEKEGLSKDNIVSVSNAFHIPRIELICSRLNVEGEFVLAPDPNPYSLFSVLVREYMSYTKLLIFGTE